MEFSNENYKRKLELGVGFVVIAIGAFCDPSIYHKRLKRNCWPENNANGFGCFHDYWWCLANLLRALTRSSRLD